MGRKKQNLLPQMYKTDPNYPDKLKRLKDMDSGSFLLNDQEVQQIKSLYKITDLDESNDIFCSSAVDRKLSRNSC